MNSTFFFFFLFSNSLKDTNSSIPTNKKINGRFKRLDVQSSRSRVKEGRRKEGDGGRDSILYKPRKKEK
jgi:hypothetical protein